MADLVTPFTSAFNDWDLEAIIRGGCVGSSCSMDDVMATSPPPPLGFNSDELEATATVLNELELLYKPFLLQHQPKCTDSDLTMTTAASWLNHTYFDGHNNGHHDDVERQKEEQEKMSTMSVADKRSRAKPSCKRRKSKQKIQVIYRGRGDEEENLAEMDQWNWRKYGQKSIRGSPYPRSYYRCSSVGGCQARKQVEQSIEENYAYTVTYMGDHSHPVPTRRRSLAGRKLTKFSTSATTSADSAS